LKKCKMKLLLTSSGLETPKLRKEFVSLLGKKVSESRILVIHTAQTIQLMSYINDVGVELKKAGISNDNITYLNLYTEKFSYNLRNYDAIYVCGGNTYHILDRIIKIGLFELIKKFVKDGGLYVGVSAGSILVGKRIEIAGWGIEGDPNDINLRNLNGFNFTNIAIYTHYKPSLKKEVNEFKQKVDYPVETLEDGKAIVIKNEKGTITKKI